MSGLDAAVEDLEAAIDKLSTHNATFADPAVLGDLVERLGRAGNRLDAAVLATTHAFDRCGGWRESGARSCKAWVRTRLGCPDSAAGRQVRYSHVLKTMPVVAQAFADGHISTAHLYWYDKASSPQRAGLFATHEQALVDKTKDLSYKDFSKAIRYWIDLANDLLGLGEPTPHDSRTASSGDAGDGMWAFNALLDALDGTEIDNELRRLEELEFDRDWAEARQRLGDEATATDLARTPGQRLADALLEMARRSASTTKPGEAAPRVINLRMDYATFIAETAAMTADDPVEYPAERVSETEAGTVLAPSRILQPTIGTHVRRVVFAPDGHILSFGRKNRLFTGGLREAIIERDQQCTHPYCQTPGRRCQVDHITEYEDGGHTNETNGHLLCGPHNRTKHQHKRQKRKQTD